MKTHELLQAFVDDPFGFPTDLSESGYISVALPFRTELHIWSNSIQRPPHDLCIHNHNWACLSKCIIGSLGNIQYRTEPYPRRPDTHNLFELESLVDLERSIVLNSGKLKILSPGELVFIGMGVFHNMWNIDSMSINTVSRVGTRPGIFVPRVARPAGILRPPSRHNPMKGLHESAIPLIIKHACGKIRNIL